MKDSDDKRNTDTSPAVLVGATLVDELIRAGVCEAVVCPGSRSAPLALAFAEASRAGRLRLHVRTDERTGAFLALGLAKYSGRPVPITMTSGTAVANCLPAMVEATLSHVPLLVLSANRPWSMIGTGANQTIEQRDIFGKHAVATLELDAAIDVATAAPAITGSDTATAPTSSAAAPAPTHATDTARAALIRQTRVKVDELVAAATDPIRGGGAHLDIPLREPLVPASATELTLLARDLAGAVAGASSEPGAATPTIPTTPTSPATTAEQTSPESSAADPAGKASATLTPTEPTPAQPARTYIAPPQAARVPFGEATIDVSKRTLVIAGSITDAAWAREQLEVLGDVPVLAEPTASAPDFPVHPAAAAMFTSGLVAAGEYSAETRPEQVIVLGRPTLHRPVTRLLADPSIDITVLTETSTITDVARTARRVASTIRVTGEQPATWLQVCRGISDLGVEATRDAITASTKAGHFTGLHAAGVLTDALRDGDAFFVGASSAIRDVARTGLPFDGVRTLANRGAAGIDGLVSSAIGVALAHASADPTALRSPRTLALVGDLSFIHDATALHFGPNEPVPDNLVIVVANDDGGAIFEGLEPGREDLRTFDDGTLAFERVFGTPTGADISAMCEAAGVDWIGVRNVGELAEALADHEDAGGFLVIEAAVDRAARVELDRQIRAKVTPDES